MDVVVDDMVTSATVVNRKTEDASYRTTVLTWSFERGNFWVSHRHSVGLR
jgi:hypothetical protein